MTTRIGVIADTHCPEFLHDLPDRVFEVLRGVDVIVHAGDVNGAQTIAALQNLGYQVIPSQANFFMVHIKKDVTPVAEEFLKRGVVVGRKFPPMNEFMRVSVGTEQEMNVFMKAFKELFPVQQTKVG